MSLAVLLRTGTNAGRAENHVLRSVITTGAMAEILKTQVFSKDQRNKRNYLIHLLYVRKEFDECLRLIEDTLAQVNEV
jgi:hypothetical protein